MIFLIVQVRMKQEDIYQILLEEAKCINIKFTLQPYKEMSASVTLFSEWQYIHALKNLSDLMTSEGCLFFVFLQASLSCNHVAEISSFVFNTAALLLNWPVCQLSFICFCVPMIPYCDLWLKLLITINLSCLNYLQPVCTTFIDPCGFLKSKFFLALSMFPWQFYIRITFTTKEKQNQ